MWGIDPGTGDPCAAAARQQVRCSRFASTLSLLRQLGRPGIVALRDDNGRTVYATLVGLGDKTDDAARPATRRSSPRTRPS